jgi:Rieske Fe-S protein
MNHRRSRPGTLPDGATRRGVLGLACVVGAGAVGGCGGQGVDVASGPVAAGKIEDFEVGALEIVNYVAVARDAGGFYAMSSVCTHAGCPTRAGASAADGLFCPCHGSLFDRNGTVLRGPARAVLPHFKVELAADGSITVQAGTEVPPDTRIQPT